MEALNKIFVFMFSLLQLHTAAVTYRSFHHPISQPGHKLSGCNHGGAGSNADDTLKHGKLGSESERMDPLFILPRCHRVKWMEVELKNKQPRQITASGGKKKNCSTRFGERAAILKFSTCF